MLSHIILEPWKEACFWVVFHISLEEGLDSFGCLLVGWCFVAFANTEFGDDSPCVDSSG